MKRMLRFVVPVDDEEHVVELAGVSSPLRLKCTSAVANAHPLGGPDAVEVWFESDGDIASPVSLRVFGTGQPVDPDWFYVGTAPRTALGLVWHLFAWSSEWSRG